jgi:hypothetical protein
MVIVHVIANALSEEAGLAGNATKTKMIHVQCSAQTLHQSICRPHMNAYENATPEKKTDLYTL